ncbi:hypothetical protein BSQ33_01880 [Vibrio gazogenes]|uniref:Uncharacterized protein n=1 Tax=Vibrio gazogenes TaxID=687 RepID=A0A1Z2SBP5_VIBGA|nr:hypothetical protein BSQ33_01880 [Vibrio gazogenes]
MSVFAKINQNDTPKTNPEKLPENDVASYAKGVLSDVFRTLLSCRNTYSEYQAHSEMNQVKNGLKGIA